MLFEELVATAFHKGLHCFCHQCPMPSKTDAQQAVDFTVLAWLHFLCKTLFLEK